MTAVFASHELVARLDLAEAALVRDATASVGVRRGAEQIEILPLGGGVAAFAGPGSPLNKCCGLGFAGALDEAELELVEERLALRGAPVRIELSSHADPSISALLTRRGYVLAGFEDVLARELGASEVTPSPGIAIEPSGDGQLARWLDVLVDGFAHPDSAGPPGESYPRDVLERVLGDIAALEGMQRCIAYLAGEPAGAAAMRLWGGVALLCGAATLPARRRRGVQTALLAWRLAAAARAGCDLACVTTQPGSKSQHNVIRQGFSLCATRAVLVREAR